MIKQAFARLFKALPVGDWVAIVVILVSIALSGTMLAVMVSSQAEAQRMQAQARAVAHDVKDAKVSEEHHTVARQLTGTHVNELMYAKDTMLLKNVVSLAYQFSDAKQYVAHRASLVKLLGDDKNGFTTQIMPAIDQSAHVGALSVADTSIRFLDELPDRSVRYLVHVDVTQGGTGHASGVVYLICTLYNHMITNVQQGMYVHPVV